MPRHLPRISLELACVACHHRHAASVACLRVDARIAREIADPGDFGARAVEVLDAVACPRCGTSGGHRLTRSAAERIMYRVVGMLQCRMPDPNIVIDRRAP
ncbi:MAG: hypothetical protein HYY16_10500 [Planctomycetes bacterium]|nr:hypothetical protein [Planctomycetota bacterium]